MLKSGGGERRAIDPGHLAAERTSACRRVAESCREPWTSFFIPFMKCRMDVLRQLPRLIARRQPSAIGRPAHCQRRRAPHFQRPQPARVFQQRHSDSVSSSG
jgi:hypothetical protein